MFSLWRLPVDLPPWQVTYLLRILLEKVLGYQWICYQRFRICPKGKAFRLWSWHEDASFPCKALKSWHLNGLMGFWSWPHSLFCRGINFNNTAFPSNHCKFTIFFYLLPEFLTYLKRRRSF